MYRLSAFRSLLIVYTPVFLLGMWEVNSIHDLTSSSNDRISDRPDVVLSYAGTLLDLYPERPDGHYFLGYRALRQRDYDLAKKHFELAITFDGRKELLLHYYAQTMVLLKADRNQIDLAIHKWKWNYPYSKLNDPNFIELAIVDTAEYKKGVESLLDNRFAAARKHFENDIKDGSRSEQLSYNYALVLVLLDEDPNGIQTAVKQWKRSYPYSKMPDPRVAVERMRRQQMREQGRSK